MKNKIYLRVKQSNGRFGVIDDFSLFEGDLKNEDPEEGVRYFELKEVKK